jgi:hypothetical protein
LYLRYKISPSLGRNAVRLDFRFQWILDFFSKFKFSAQGRKLLKQMIKAKYPRTLPGIKIQFERLSG